MSISFKDKILNSEINKLTSIILSPESYPKEYIRFIGEIESNLGADKIKDFSERLLANRKKEMAIYKNWKYRIEDRNGKVIYYEYLDDDKIILRDCVSITSDKQIIFSFYIIKKESLASAFSKLF